MTTESELKPNNPYSKILTYEAAIEIVNDIQKINKKVVLTTGVYDLFHYKHAESLACISLLGDFTVVGIPGDLEISVAGLSGTQSKDSRGSIVDYEKRAKMVSHLDYVDLIFKKTTNKLDLVTRVQPNVLAQSITSGVKVIKEVLDLTNYFQTHVENGNMMLELPGGMCKIVFIDDVIGGVTNIIDYRFAVEKAADWENNRFSNDKFHGSLIKNEIIRRATENK